MSSSKKTAIPLLILLLVFMGVTSCKPAGKQAAPAKTEKESAEVQGETTSSVLSKEQIVEIANGVARRHGYDPKEMVYDEGNASWKKEPRGPWPELEGHDFQVVYYSHRSPYTAGGGLWVLVDRNTGKVLRVVGAP
jgi:hypothetical protein